MSGVVKDLALKSAEFEPKNRYRFRQGSILETWLGDAFQSISSERIMASATLRMLERVSILRFCIQR